MASHEHQEIPSGHTLSAQALLDFAPSALPRGVRRLFEANFAHVCDAAIDWQNAPAESGSARTRRADRGRPAVLSRNAPDHSLFCVMRAGHSVAASVVTRKPGDAGGGAKKSARTYLHATALRLPMGDSLVQVQHCVLPCIDLSLYF